MKKRGPKTKPHTPEIRSFVLQALRQGYSLNRIVRATSINVERIILWRDEEGIEPILHTSGARQKLPDLVFDL